MAIHNLSHVEEPKDYSPAPPGNYPLRVVKSEQVWSSRGTKQWKVIYVITEGPFAGKSITDFLTWDNTSETLFGRIKHVLDRLQVDWRGVDDDYPEILIGRECYGPVTQEKYEDKKGTTRIANRLGFTGFSIRETPLQPYSPVPPKREPGMDAPQHPPAGAQVEPPW